MNRKQDITCLSGAFLIWLCAAGIAVCSAGGGAESKVDYVAKLNELARQGRNESLNAAIFYEQAAILRVSLPYGLGRWDLDKWPSELTDEKQSQLRQWVLANSSAFSKLKLGTRKPYYWNQYIGDSIWRDAYPPGLEELGDIVLARLLRVKFAVAMVGVTRDTIDDIFTCCRFGSHLAQSCNETAQLQGLLLVDRTAQTVLLCLARTDPDWTATGLLQSGIQEQFSKNHNHVTRLLKAEKLKQLEVVQRLFPGTDDNSKLRPADEMEMSGFRGIAFEDIEALRRGKTLRDIDAAFAYCEEFLGASPWQAKEKGFDFWEDLYVRTGKNPLVCRYIFDVPRYARVRAHCRAGRDALLTVLAVLRFRHDKHRLPTDLQELLSTDYLSQLPMDPYSDGPLVYRLTGDNFMLYSLSDDFDDDGGVASDWARGAREGDHVFWPQNWR